LNNFTMMQKIYDSLKNLKYDAVLVCGSDNAQYLSGALLPFAPYRRGQVFMVFLTKEGESACFCPAEWESTVRETGWVKSIIPYNSNGEDPGGLIEAVAQLLKNMKTTLSEIGIDLDRMPRYLFEALRVRLPGLRWVGCDSWLAKLRMVKTPAEVQLLEEAAFKTDHGINGAIHHVTVDRRITALTLAEELRVHTEERGIDLVGYHAASHVSSGDEAKTIWSNPPKYGYSMTNDLHSGEMVRMKILTCHNGYWADATRMMIMGDPTPQQSEAFKQMVLLRDKALELIKPGTKCSDVYAGICAEASKANIAILEGMELGHGVGVTPWESPFISPCDSTILEEGMVLVLDPFVRDPAGNIWQSKDTLVVTDCGNRILGWYKDWREPYIPIASI